MIAKIQVIAEKSGLHSSFIRSFSQGEKNNNKKKLDAL